MEAHLSRRYVFLGDSFWESPDGVDQMTQHEQLIEEIRERLKDLKGAGMVDPMAIANELVGLYSFAFEEIRAVVIKEADAAGIPLVAR